MGRKQYHVYILTNKYNTVLCTGATGDLKRRVYEHKTQVHEGFTKKYKIHKLVYYEAFDDIDAAIAREKQIKAGSRQKEVDLLQSMNPGRTDLYEEI
jgi:putative endonuclease